MYTLTQSINWAKTFIQYSPITAGFGQEPAVSVATMIRNTILNPPQTWLWNRGQTTFSTVKSQQDYYVSIPDLGFIEKVTLTDSSGKIFEIKDVYNTSALGVSADEQRPNAISIENSAGAVIATISSIAITSNVVTVNVTSVTGLLVGQQLTIAGLSTATYLNGQVLTVSSVNPGGYFTANFVHANVATVADTGTATGIAGIQLRFMGVPNAVYTATLIYQKRAVIFGPFLITSCGNHVAANTTYTGSFDPLAFPAGALAQITGFVTNAVNNGTFVVVSCTTTSLIVVNGAGVAETASAFVSNFDWAPIPDQYSDIYNNLFLSEMLAVVDDARSQIHRQRGIAAYLAKATGLTETQRNAFLNQWISRGIQEMVAPLRAQQGVQARAV